MNSDQTELRSLAVHLLPELADLHDLAGDVVIVVDVLRASTTILAALEAGAESVVPCLEVPEARRLAHRHRSEMQVLLGGERGGEPIDGFDLGNSPAEYSANAVQAKRLVFTTTNGTRALMRCVGAGTVLIGSFWNVQALVDLLNHGPLVTEPRVHVICAGTEGAVSWEDVLWAGAFTERLAAGTPWQFNDAARLAEAAWKQVSQSSTSDDHAPALAEALRLGQGGRNLLRIGRGSDIALAARVDCSSGIPRLDLGSWMIRLF